MTIIYKIIKTSSAFILRKKPLLYSLSVLLVFMNLQVHAQVLRKAAILEDERITTASATLPDLTLQNTSLNNTTVHAGDTLSITATVLNQGEQEALGYGSLQYFFLSSPTLTNADIPFFSKNGQASLAANTSEVIAPVKFAVPEGTLSGNYYIVIAADKSGLINEDDENNNLTTLPFTVVTTGASPDLITVNPLATPATLMPGDSCAISCSIINLGTGNTGSGFTIVYAISTDKTFDETDAVLGNSSMVTALPASGSINVPSKKFKLPDTLVPGTYYIVYYADKNNSIPETNNDNNTSFYQINLINLPDFSISNAVGPAKTYAGDSLLISSAVLNEGGNSQNNIVDVQYYLSKDAQKDDSDISLSNYILLNSPGPAKSTNVPASAFFIPGSTAPGTYYILLICDGKKAERESNEDNNVSGVPLIVETRPDFRITAKANKITLFPGDTLRVTGSIQNTGSTSTLAGSSLEYYLSTDDKLDNDDAAIASSYDVPVLPAGTTVVFPEIFYAVPKSNIPGTYYVLLKSDAKNTVREASETNNLAALKIDISSPYLADLLFKSTYISPSALVVGDTLTIETSLSNEGAVASPSSKLQYFLSTDVEFDEGDIALGNEIPVPSLAIAALWKAPSVRILLPPATKAGTYYVLLLADKNKSFAEISETNNLSVLIIKIAARADLSLTVPAIAPTGVYEGDSAAISCTVVNLGAGSTATYVSLQYFLSTDTIYDLSDIPLSNFISIAPIQGNTSRKAPAGNYLIPKGTASGSYHVLMVIDNNLALKESVENNNIAHVPIKVLSFADLVVQNAQFSPQFLLQGDEITVSTSIKNIGKGGTESTFNISYFLSKDQRFDKADLPISGLLQVSQLGSGEISLSSQAKYSFSDKLAPGIWYILIKADQDSLVRESDETNNFYALEVTVGDPELADLRATNAFIPFPELVAGDTLSIGCIVENFGKIDVTAAYQLQYYLSKDNSYDNSDIPLGEAVSMNPLLTGKKQQLAPIILHIPLSVVPGKYYLLAFPDMDNKVNESIEKNNLLPTPLDIIPFPDFKLRKTSISPSSVYIGDPLQAAVTISNGGGSKSQRSISLQYFLSRDPVYDENDLAIGRQISIGKLSVNQDTILPVEKLSIPLTLTGGYYYLIPFVDSKSQVIEINERNNTNPVPLEIKPRPVVILPDSLDSKNNNIHLDVSVRSEIPVASVVFTYRKITDTLKTVSQLLPLGSRYSANIPKDSLDEIGSEYIFLATDSSGNKSLLSKGSTPVSWNEPGLVIPYKSYGKSVNNYRIISVPLHLKYNRIDSVMNKVLGIYDKKKWRIFNYRSNSNREFMNGTDTLVPGVGYWFIAADTTPTPIYTGAGTTVVCTAENPFSIKLSQGWNQIGNPYNLNLSIKEIKQYKLNNSAIIGNWLKYLNDWYGQGDTLHKMEGAFVFAKDTTTLYFPTKRNNKLQPMARIEATVMNEDNWQISLSVEGQGIKYRLAGFGMHENATLSADEFDEFTPPAFSDFLEINFNHPEYFYPKFTKDIISSCEEHIWEFEVKASKGGNKVLHWDNNYISNKKLMLYDRETERAIDMGRQNSFAFESGDKRSFKIFYGTEDFVEHALQPERITLGAARPNPFSEHTTFSISLPATSAQHQIHLSIYNALGQKVQTLTDASYPPGFHEFTWNGIASGGEKLPQGMYVLKLEVNNDGATKELSKKILLQ